MIVCICGNVSEAKVKAAIAQGCATLEDLQMELGVCCGCCCCKAFLEEQLKNASSNH